MPSRELLPRERWEYVAREFKLEDGTVLWQCPVCRGIYKTEIQASNVGNGNGQGDMHKCKAGRRRRTIVDEFMDPFRLIEHFLDENGP